MPTPNHPALPLCCQLAAQPARYLFATWLENLRLDQPQEARASDAQRLKGMLHAYMEMNVVSTDQHREMCEELNDFAYGATV